MSATTKPRVYTLCGSTRFPDAFALATMHLSAMGHIAIGPGIFRHANKPQGARFLDPDGDETNPAHQVLEELHFRKIDLSDAIFVVNVGGYVGSSTRREIAYALSTGKTVEWMFPDAIPTEFTTARRDRPEPDDVTFISIVRWRDGMYEWNGMRHMTEDKADTDPTSPGYEVYVGRLHGDELVSVRRHGDTIVLTEPAWLAHVASRIGLKVATS